MKFDAISMTPTPDPTVPIIADGLARDRPEDLARCVYFTVVADDPGTTWDLGLGTFGALPFLMLGLEGIITRPLSPDEPEFTGFDLIVELIDAVEAMEGFSVETGFFWIPTELLDRAFSAANPAGPSHQSMAERGSVFRVGRELFARAIAAARDASGFDEFTGMARDQIVGDGPKASLRYSAIETEAFRAWSSSQVAASENFQR